MRLCFGDLPQRQQELVQPEAWQRIRSPGSRLGYLLAALIGLMFPNLLCSWLLLVSAVAARSGSDAASVAGPMPWGAVIVALLVFVPLHELLHALWHPKGGLTPETILVVWPAKLRFGVYYDGCLTRRRWLLMRLAPLVLLCGIPAGLLALFRYLPAPLAAHIFLQVLMLVNGIGSGGDIVAAATVLLQVPAAAHICFHEGKAYWRAAGHIG
ncbi:MAG: DUF3267 domain-containing protein [Anaerolineales bacterium]|nr:MAG: DUF3267 domain-containing protein [Anaerolineales bacterium]